MQEVVAYTVPILM